MTLSVCNAWFSHAQQPVPTHNKGDNLKIDCKGDLFCSPYDVLYYIDWSYFRPKEINHRDCLKPE